MRRAQCSVSAGGQCGKKASAARSFIGSWDTSGLNGFTDTLTSNGMNLIS